MSSPLKHSMQTLISFNDVAHSRPLTAGIIGTISGWGAWALEALQVTGSIVGDIGKIFGSVAAFYTMLIVIRNYHGKGGRKTPPSLD